MEMTSMVDRGFHSNAMFLATLNASCIEALRQPILFRVPASYTIMSVNQFSKVHHDIIFSQDFIVSVPVEHIRTLQWSSSLRTPDSDI